MGQYGMTFGGPIKKDKTFFFLSYEGLRQLQSTTQVLTLPSGFVTGGSSFQQQVLNMSPLMCEIMQGYPWRASVGTISGCSPRFVYPDAAFQWLGQNPSDCVPGYRERNRVRWQYGREFLRHRCRIQDVELEVRN